MIELKKCCLAAVLVFFLFLFTGCDGSSPDPGTVNGGGEVIAPVFIGSAEARDMNVSPSREDVAELYYKWYAPSFISFKPVEMTSDTYPVVILGTPVNLKVTVSDKTVTYTGKSAHEKIYLELEYNMETDKFDYYQCFAMEDLGMKYLLLSSGKDIQVDTSDGSFSGDISFIVMHYNNPGIEVEGVKYPVFVGDCHLYSDGTNSGTLVYQSNDSESEPDSYLTYSELTKIDDPLFSFNYTDGNELKNHFDDDINMKQYYVFCYYKGGQYSIEPDPSLGYEVNPFPDFEEANTAVSKVFPDWKISPESTVSEQYE